MIESTSLPCCRFNSASYLTFIDLIQALKVKMMAIPNTATIALISFDSRDGRDDLPPKQTFMGLSKWQDSDRIFLEVIMMLI